MKLEKTGKALSKMLLLLTITFSLTLPTLAQVTIGSGESSIDGALLQLKNKAGINDDGDNATKGLAFPRVQLSQKDRLYPMFGTAGSENSDYTNDRVAINKKHTGLVVYNTYTSPNTVTDANLIFNEGLYVWLGDTWTSIATPQAENGLTLTSTGIIKLGGTLTEDTEIKQNGKVLKIASDEDLLYITGLVEGSQTDSRALVVNVNTGEVGTAPTIPAILTFAQSTTEYTFNSGSTAPGKNGTMNTTNAAYLTSLNTGMKVAVPFAASDIKDNKLTKFDETNNVFTLIQSGAIEVSGYANYYCDHADPDEVLLNLTIQVRKNTGTPGSPTYGNWEDFSSVRAVWVGAQTYYRNTLTVPPAIHQGEIGDQIRMVIVRPYDVSGTTAKFLGGIHGKNNGYQVSFTVPYGTKFSRGLKIISQ